jgi:hypothetical protein
MEMHSYALRVPKDIWEEVRLAAKVNRRSVNQEIVWRLSERGGFGRDGTPAGGSPSVGPPRSEGSPGFRPDFKGG